MANFSSAVVQFDLRKFGGLGWAEQRGNFFDVCNAIDDADHYRLLNGSRDKKGLRPADVFMMKTTVKQRAWPCPDNLDAEQWERNMNK